MEFNTNVDLVKFFRSLVQNLKSEANALGVKLSFKTKIGQSPIKSYNEVFIREQITALLTANLRNTTGFLFEGVTQAGSLNTQTVDFANPNTSVFANRWVRYGFSGVAEEAIEDGSYIRLKNVSLGYTLPVDLVKKVGLTNARVAFSAQNLLTITDYSGLDPEVSYFGGGGQTNNPSNPRNPNTTAGFDYGNYPTIKSYTFSVNLKF